MMDASKFPDWADGLDSFATWMEGGLVGVPESERTEAEGERARIVSMMRECAADWRLGRAYGAPSWGRRGACGENQ